MCRNRVSEILEKRGQELKCYDCKEELLIFPSDKVDAVINPKGIAIGVLCSVCWIKRRGDEERDERERRRRER